MKYMIRKAALIMCAVCMLFVNCTAYAANSVPSVLIKTDGTGKVADIIVKNAGTMVYSAQITLSVTPKTASYTLKGANNKIYTTIKSEDGNLVLYMDSTELFNGKNEINFATLKSDKEMKIGTKADLVLVDGSMNSHTYSGVRVSVSKKSNSNTSAGGGGGGVSGGSNTGIIQGGQKTPSLDLNTTAKSFSDVSDNHWAKSSIDYVVEKGLFNGMSDTTFEPNREMTRAMYVVVLNRFGTKIDSKWQIPCDNPVKFNDIDDGKWYADAVAWAGGIGLVNGLGDNIFAPDNSVTREQIAVMTVNFAKLCGVELPSNVGESEFADEASISSWAVEAVHAAQRAGIINGREDKKFSPRDTATRAEVAAILHRFAEITK